MRSAYLCCTSSMGWGVTWRQSENARAHARQGLERFRGTMWRRRVAAGCSNTHSDSISMHKFPKDSELRKKWEKQVQRTRERWSATENSFLCSEHFEAECFEVDSMLAEQMGLKKRRRLKPDAVPTIFVRHVTPQQTTESSSSCEAPALTTARKRAPASSSTVGTGDPPKKRMAFEKRERLRASWWLIHFRLYP